MTKKDDSKWILNMGAGTVAVRDADVQLSLGMRVAMVKYGNYPDDADGSDSKTQGLKDLLERHKDVDIPVFAALGDPEKIGDLERRVGLIKKHVGRCDGSVEDFVKKEKENIALAIDLTDGNGVDQWNHDDLYKPYNLPFAVNGGGNKIYLCCFL